MPVVTAVKRQKLPKVNRYEATVRACCKAVGLPEPTPEHRFHAARKWRFDFAFPAHRVAVEVQGGLFSGGAHVRGAALIRDHEKRNTAAMYGWRILYTTPSQVNDISFWAMVAGACK